MIVQSVDISAPVRESADVCIIGSGCGGGASAKILSEAGKRVIVVEDGGYYRPEDFEQTEEWAYSHLYVQRAGLSTEDLAVTVLQGRSVGGSSTVNWTTSLRTPDFTLERWVRDHGLMEYSPEALDPWFTKVESYLDLTTEPDGRHNSQNRNLLRGAGKLGYRAEATGRNVKDCVALGVCGFGCPSGAKRSVDVTYIRDAVAAGCTVLSDARATRIHRGDGTRLVEGWLHDRATRVRTQPFSVEAKVVIVAGSSTSSPLILGASDMGGSSGALGKNLTFHLTTAVLGVYDAPQTGWKGIPQSSMCDHFLNANGDGGGYWVECAPFGPAIAALSVPSFGAKHAELMTLLPYISVFIVLVKEVDSSGTVRANEHGRPLLTYDRGPRDTRYMIEGIETAARLHFAAGARSIFTLHAEPTMITSPDKITSTLRGSRWNANDVVTFSAHPLGTCRMGADPGSSVVDSHGAVHGERGVFVLDGSILPSSLGVNPQVSILAVAEKNATWIAENWANIVSAG